MLASLLLLHLACQPQAPPPQPPDLVLVVIDTLRADHLALYGHERATSPQLQALARESLVFDRALAHSSWTLPSMASLLTGRYPSEHQATRDPDDPMRFNRMVEDLPTLAGLLQARGYKTAAWVNNTYMAPEFDLDQGFEVYDYVGSSGTEERSAATTVAAALDWLQGQREPVFLFLHFMEPHYPYLPPPELRRRFTGPGEPPVDLLFFSATELASGARLTKRFQPEQQAWIRRLYDEEVLAADRAVGQLVAGLRAQGRWEPTVLALTADHGEEHWDHGAFEHGHSLYGEQLRVPLLLRTPQAEPGRSHSTVQLVDLFHTLGTLGGARLPPGTHGEDLRALAASEASAAHRPVLSEDCLYGPPRVALTQGDLRLVLNLDSKVANVFELDEYGQADRMVQDDERAQTLAAPLADAMRQLRGDLSPRRLGERSVSMSAENIQQLRALGYLE